MNYHKDFTIAIEDIGSLALDAPGWRSCVIKKGYKSIVDLPLLSANFDDTKYITCLFDGEALTHLFEIDLPSVDTSVQFVLYNPLDCPVTVKFSIYFDIRSNERFFICQDKRACLIARELSLSDQYQIPTGVSRVVFECTFDNHRRIFGAAITMNATGPRECSDGGGSDWEAEFYEEEDRQALGQRIHQWLCQ